VLMGEIFRNAHRQLMKKLGVSFDNGADLEEQIRKKYIREY
jgi:hypothetical protein